MMQAAIIAAALLLLSARVEVSAQVIASPAIDGLLDEATLARALRVAASNAQLASSPAPPVTPRASLPAFPWPYPPQFEAYLPSTAKQSLVALYVDTTLTPDERTKRVNQVFDELPLAIVSRLPLPEGYERLPADVYARIAYVHSMPGFGWSERQALIHEIVDALPIEQRRLMTTRLDGPPPGFELVLAPSVYKQLLAIHYNRQLTKTLKSALITRVMRQVPQSQIDRLPLPAGMQHLPLELQSRLRTLIYDYSVPQPERAQRVRAYVASLPAEYRPPL